jgi:CheY-like chemotaxis protein
MQPPARHRPMKPPGTEGLNPFASALLGEVAEFLGEVSNRLALARGQAGSGGVSTMELRRLQEEVDDFQVVLSMAMTEAPPSAREGEERFALGAVVESAVDRWIPSSPRVLTTFRSSLPQGSVVRGSSSVLARALRGLLRNSARGARSRLWIDIRPAGDPSAPDVPRHAEIRILRDGPLGAEGTEDDPSLLLARWGIHRLGGTLSGPEWVETGSGEAVAFRLELPLAHPSSKEVQRGRSWRPEGTVPGPLDGVRIAVVDDEPALRSVLARLLNRAGADVSTLAPELGDPVEALTRRILSDPPDLVLLDLHLGRMSGRRVLELLRERSGPCVILLTGDPGQAQDLSCPVMAKPVDWPALVRRIQEVLAER